MATTLNLRALVDALGGTAGTAAVFNAEVCQSGSPAARLAGDAVTFPQPLTCHYDGSTWDRAPQLTVLPAGFYWAVSVAMVNGASLRRTVTLPTSPPASLDFAALVDVDPSSAVPSGSALSIWLAAVDQRVTVLADPQGAAASAQAAAAADATTKDAALAASLSATYSTLAQLAASPDLLAVGTITRSASGAATSFAVAWPDGATGTFTGTESSSFPGAIDAYTVTKTKAGTTVTFTQPALTRDANGAVTGRPAITVA